MHFNWLDYVLMAFLLYSTVASAMKGFTRQVVGLLAAVVAVILGMWFYGTAGTLLQAITGPGRAANLLGFLVIFIAVLIAGTFVGSLIERFIKATGLSFVDRLLGAAFGLARGTLIAVALIAAYTAFGFHGEGAAKPAAVVDSKITPYLMEASRALVAMAPMDLKSSFQKQYEQLKAAAQNAVREKFRPKMKQTFDTLIDHLMGAGFFLGQAVEILEKGMIERALLSAKANQSEAAKLLGIHRNTLQRKMAEYSIAGKRPKRKQAGRAMARAAKAGSRRAS